MSAITREERAALNALMLRGLHGAALCVEKLLRDGEAVLAVSLAGPAARIEIVPPAAASALWRDAATWRQTAAEVGYFTVRRACEIRWSVSQAEDELRRISTAARRVH